MIKRRRLRLCRQRGSDAPEVRFGGLWFANQGFNVGDFIDLILDGKQIIIRHTPKEEATRLIEERSKWKR